MAILTMRAATLLTAALLFPIGITGCASSTGGTPTPASPNDSTTGAPTSSPDALQSLDACTLLTQQEAAQFKPKAPGQLNTTGSSGAASDCEWIGRTKEDDSMAFGVLVRPTQSVDSVNANGGQLTNGSLSGRPAVKLVGHLNDTCIIALAVTPASRIDVTVTSGTATDPTEICQVADTIAGYVNPRLPKYPG